MLEYYISSISPEFSPLLFYDIDSFGLYVSLDSSPVHVLSVLLLLASVKFH